MGGEAYPVVFSSLLGFLLFPVGFGKGVPESSDSVVQNLKIKDGSVGSRCDRTVVSIPNSRKTQSLGWCLSLFDLHPFHFNKERHCLFSRLSMWHRGVTE